MPLQIQSCNLHLNQTQTFSFGGKITQYTAGVSEIYLRYGAGEDRHVHEAMVSLLVEHPSENDLTVQAILNLCDSSGHQMSSDSYVTVVVVVWISTTNVSLTLSGATSIPDGYESKEIEIGSKAPTILESALAGFKLDFSGDHHLQAIEVAVQAKHTGTTATLAATATMNDASGNEASKAFADGMLIAYSDASPGFQVRTTVNLEANSKVYPRTQTVTFAGGVTRAMVLLKSFRVTFPKDIDVPICVIWAYARGGPDVQNPSYDVGPDQNLVVFGDVSMVGKYLNGHDVDKSSIVALVIGY